MKKLISVMLSSMVALNLSAITMAEDNMPEIIDAQVAIDGVIEPSTEAKTFTVESAIEYAKANSPTIKGKKISMDSAEVALKQTQVNKYTINKTSDILSKAAGESLQAYKSMQLANEEAEKLGSSAVYSDNELKAAHTEYLKTSAPLESMITFSNGDAALQSVYLVNGYYVDAAQVSYDNAKLSYDETLRTIDSTVSLSFYSCIALNDKISIASQSIDNAKTRYDQALIKYNNGSLSAIDLESYNLAITSAENTYNTLVCKKSITEKAFKQLIGCPIETPITLIGAFTRIEMDPTPLNEAKTMASISVNAKLLDNSYKTAEKGLYWVGKLYSASNLTYQSAKLTFESSQLTYNQNKELLPLSAEYYYNSMLNAYESLSYLDSQIAYMERQTEIQRIRADQGTITAQDYIETVQKLDDLRITQKDAELGAYQSVVNYKTSYTTGSFTYSTN